MKTLLGVQVEQILAYDRYDKIGLYMYATVFAKKHKVYYKVLKPNGHFTDPIQSLEQAIIAYNSFLTDIDKFELEVRRVKELFNGNVIYSTFRVCIQGDFTFRSNVALRVVRDLNLRGADHSESDSFVTFLMPQ